MEIMHSDGGHKGLTKSMITEQIRQKALNHTDVIKDKSFRVDFTFSEGHNFTYDSSSVTTLYC